MKRSRCGCPSLPFDGSALGVLVNQATNLREKRYGVGVFPPVGKVEEIIDRVGWIDALIVLDQCFQFLQPEKSAAFARRPAMGINSILGQRPEGRLPDHQRPS